MAEPRPRLCSGVLALPTYIGQAMTFPILFVDWRGRRMYDHRFVLVALMDIFGNVLAMTSIILVSSGQRSGWGG